MGVIAVAGETLGTWILDGRVVSSSEPFRVSSAIAASFALSCKLVYTYQPDTANMGNRKLGQ